MLRPYAAGMAQPSLRTLIQWARARARARIVGGVLCVTLVAQLASTSRDLLVARTSAAPADPAPMLARGRARADLSRITAAHLFGATPLASVESAAVVAKADAALLLSGTIALSDDPAEGSAVVGTKGGTNHLVAVGHEIVQGVTLDSVYPDRIVLRHSSGALESLAFARGLGNQLYALQANNPAGRPMDGQDDDESDHPDETGGLNPEQVSAKLAAATSGLTNVLTASGAFEGTAYKGIRLEPGNDPDLFARLGFKPGDMVLGINGITLNDPSMLAMLKGSGTLRVGVRRPSGAEIITVDAAALR